MAVISIYAQQETYVEKLVNPDSNFDVSNTGQINAIYIGGDKAFLYRTFVLFDCSMLIDRTINSVKMVRQISFVANGGFAALADRIDDTHCPLWVASEATWNDYRTGDAWDVPGGDGDITDPDLINYTEASGTGEYVNTEAGFKEHVEAALNSSRDPNLNGLVCFLMLLNDESPGSTTGVVWDGGDASVPPRRRWRLEIDYVGGPSGVALGSANVGFY